MLAGRNFVAHLVLSTIANGQPTIVGKGFRATAAATAAGEITVTLTDDCAEVDACAVVSSSPNGGVAGGAYVGINVKRSAVNTYKILTTPATTADAPGVGFPAAPAEPASGTIIEFTLDRVDTV